VDTLKEKWTKKVIKYKRLTDMLDKCLIKDNSDGYEMEIRAGFIVVSSLGALHPNTKKCLDEVTSRKGVRIDKQGMDLWLKRIVIESIKGSFNLWIKASPRAMGGFDVKESYEDLKKQNEELGISEDKKQVNNDLHEVLLNGIATIDEALLNTNIADIKKKKALELVSDDQTLIKRIKNESLIKDDNQEVKKRLIINRDIHQESDEENFNQEVSQEVEKGVSLSQWIKNSSQSLGGMSDNELSIPSDQEFQVENRHPFIYQNNIGNDTTDHEQSVSEAESQPETRLLDRTAVYQYSDSELDEIPANGE
jgi:hypothetical protein